ncbi:MAG TPA: endonuclease/exonuclease/phosphatase family protein [Anaerolineales bacterium]|nr:endonuclease/exonuclease/phosphatase family protein [Anaerolineales bacterium]
MIAHRRRWPILLAVLIGFLLTAWVLNASTAGERAQGCPQGCSVRATRRPGPLRVMSFNVLHGFPNFENLGERLELAAAEILRQDADLVLLQEVPWTRQVRDGAKFLAERVGFNYLYLRAQGNHWAILFEDGVAVLSRFPLKEPAVVELKPREMFFEPRVALSAVAETPWGDLPLFVTHLASSDDQINRGQVVALREFVASRTDGLGIVAGDFNATPDTPQIESLTEGWIDTYHTANPQDMGLTCCIDDLHAPPGEPLEERIDYIFLVPGRGVQVISAQLILDQPSPFADGWLWASDHVGLLVIMEFP